MHNRLHPQNLMQHIHPLIEIRDQILRRHNYRINVMERVVTNLMPLLVKMFPNPRADGFVDHNGIANGEKSKMKARVGRNHIAQLLQEPQDASNHRTSWRYAGIDGCHDRSAAGRAGSNRRSAGSRLPKSRGQRRPRHLISENRVVKS